MQRGYATWKIGWIVLYTKKTPRKMDGSNEMIYDSHLIYKWESLGWSSIPCYLLVTYCYAIEINYTNKLYHADTSIAEYLHVADMNKHIFNLIFVNCSLLLLLLVKFIRQDNNNLWNKLYSSNIYLK